MRILQIIDSLEAGGAERMAVNYANGLAHTVGFSAIIATRKKGPLLEQINKNVEFLFLDRKKKIDIPALIRLRNFVKKHKISLIHAHSTSFFIAFLLKLTCPSLKLIWHDHYGNSEYLEKRGTSILRVGLSVFDGIVVVNKKLKIWAIEKLNFKNVIYLPNFVSVMKNSDTTTILKSEEGKRIVCLANLRAQKNHFLVLKLAEKIKKDHPDWSFHLVGKDFNDAYSNRIKSLIIEKNLQETVFVYGVKQDIGNILSHASIGILTSKSEGLPVALLEYGLYQIPVVVTAVGEIPMIVHNGENGFLIPSHEEDSFYEALVKLIESDDLKSNFGKALNRIVKKEYTEEKVIFKYLAWLKSSNL